MMKLIKQESKRYLSDEDHEYGNGNIVLKSVYEGLVRPTNEVTMRIRCLDCGQELKVYYTRDNEFDDFIEIGGVMGTRIFWKEVFKEILGE